MITAYGRNDAVPNDHPQYIGPLGRAGSPEAAEACRHADLLLVVGSRLGHFTTYYDQRYIQPGTRIVQIDIDSRDIGRTYAVTVGIQADARESLSALLQALEGGARPGHQCGLARSNPGITSQAPGSAWLPKRASTRYR